MVGRARGGGGGVVMVAEAVRDGWVAGVGGGVGKRWGRGAGVGGGEGGWWVSLTMKGHG